MRAIVRLFGLRVEAEDIAELGRETRLVLVHHSSSSGTLIASTLVTGPQRVGVDSFVGWRSR